MRPGLTEFLRMLDKPCELAGTRFVGLVIGYSIDAATPRKDLSKQRGRELYGCADCE